MNKLGLARLLYRIMSLLPLRYPIQDKKRTVQSFFVFGSGRNGSTMLNRMLNQHPEIFLPSEQYFLGPSIFKFRFYNYFLLWRDLVKVIVGELNDSTQSHTWENAPVPNLSDLFKLEGKDRNLLTLLDKVYLSGASPNTKIWGDTTPLNTYYLPEIYNTFSAAKFIFLIRDGRDVAASYKRGGSEILGDFARPKNAARHWLHSIHKYEWLKKQTTVKLVKYEELVKHPEQTLSEICKFLEVEYFPKMLKFYDNIPDATMYKLPVHQNLKQEVFTTSIGNFQRDLTAEELSDISKLMAKKLEAYGY